MFPQENEYWSLLPKNAHGSPNFDKAACTNSWNNSNKTKFTIINSNKKKNKTKKQKKKTKKKKKKKKNSHTHKQTNKQKTTNKQTNKQW